MPTETYDLAGREVITIDISKDSNGNINGVDITLSDGTILEFSLYQSHWDVCDMEMYEWKPPTAQSIVVMNAALV